MRPDMAKVLVERPRPASRVPRGRDGRRFRDASDAAFLPMKAGYRDLKSLNENLQPLARYLARQVNRPWNAVYREICAVIDARNAVQRHILQHLTDYVALHTRLVRGTLMDLGHPYLGPGPVWQPLYVHPRTQLLRRNPGDTSWREQCRKRALEAAGKRAARWRALSPTRQLHCLDGHWFAVEIAALPPAPGSVWDAVRRCRITQGPSRGRLALDERAAAELYGQPGVYAVSKRQLSAREIRSYGLGRPIRDSSGESCALAG
jgi:hypothetical protein